MGSWTVLLLLLVSLLCACASAQIPNDPTNVIAVKTDKGTMRVKNTTGLCDSEAVQSIAGYLDVADDVHLHFWFFASRSDPTADPVTIHVAGGPGADSVSLAVQGVGPCTVTEDLTTVVGNRSWNARSNFLFISQPVNIGFSYGREVLGFVDEKGYIQETPEEFAKGRYGEMGETVFRTSKMAAEALYDGMQIFYAGLPQVMPVVKSRTLNFVGESYAGRLIPVIADHFRERNDAVANGTTSGEYLEIGLIGIISGCHDAKFEARYADKFAVGNTYGIRMVNDSVTQDMEDDVPAAIEAIDKCRAVPEDRQRLRERTCTRANVAGGKVGSHIDLGLRDVYDIRQVSPNANPALFGGDNAPARRDIPRPGFRRLLQSQQRSKLDLFFNEPRILNALGVRLNSTGLSSPTVGDRFNWAGDSSRVDAIAAIERLLAAGTRVYLSYGDADWICNWFSGEDLSLSLNHAGADGFRAAGYAPLLVNGTERGAVRQHGNLTFIRNYNTNHFILFNASDSAFEVYDRAVTGRAIADGRTPARGQLVSTRGPEKSTFLNDFVPLPNNVVDAGGPPPPRTPGGLLTEQEGYDANAPLGPEPQPTGTPPTPTNGQGQPAETNGAGRSRLSRCVDALAWSALVGMALCV